MNTTSDIHGHEVLHLVHDHPGTFTAATLRAELARRYGPEARYCTCSRYGMTFDELLGFLLARGKMVETAGLLRTEISKVCGHGEPHDHDHEH